MSARHVPRFSPHAWILPLALLWPLTALAQASAPSHSPVAPPAQALPQAARPAPSGVLATAVPPATPATSSVPPSSSPPLAAKGPQYDIEIIIFRAKIGLGSPESWSAEAGALSSTTVSGGEAPSGSGQLGELLSILPRSQYRLTSLVRRLRASGVYQPVAHAAWVQTASAWGTRAGFSLQTLGIDVPGLSGRVIFERGEFLHLGMQLDYTMQHPPPGLGAPPGTTFSMNETRRVRFYQSNYFDHPAFGVIALVTPAKGPRPPGR